MSRKTGKPSQPVPTPKTADRKVVGLVSLLAVAVALGAGVGLLIASPGAGEAGTSPQIAAIRAEEAKRDVAQIIELTSTTRNTRTVLLPVLSGLAAGNAATADQITAWKAVMAQETQRYSVTVSGTTATNVARGAFRYSVGILSSALDTYAVAQVSGPQQQTLLELATRQRKLAIATWSVAATQLDQLNNDAGNGHQHVFLTDSPDGGAMTADGSPEGR